MTSKQRKEYTNLLNALIERAEEGKLKSVREIFYFSAGYAPTMQIKYVSEIIDYLKATYELTFDYQY